MRYDKESLRKENAMLNVVQDLCFLAILVICVMAKIKNIKSNHQEINQENNWTKRYGKFIFILIFLIFAISLTFKIGEIPKGLHVDEAGAFYDAICLSKYGVDRYLNKLPVYLINFGGGQSALYAYLAAIIIKIFGANVIAFRLPAILLSLISMLFFYKAVEENNGKKEALLTVLIFAIAPWNIMKSRWGLDCYLMSSLLAISIYSLVKAVNKNKQYWYVISGILFGLTLYTYVISYIMLPIILAIILLYLLIIKKIKIQNIITMAIPLAILAMPLILMICYNKGWLENINIPIFSVPKLWFFRGGEIAIKNIPENLQNIFDILFIKDFLNYNAIEEFGNLYKLSIPFVIFGLIEVSRNVFEDIKRKEFSLDFVMLATFVVTFVVGLCIEELNINKINGIYIPMIYFAGRFLCYIANHLKYVILGVILLYIFSYAMFMNFYFTEFANTDLSYFEEEIMLAAEKAESLNKSQIYVENCVNQTYIYTLIATPISPYEFNENLKIENGGVLEYGKYKFEIPEKIDENAVYIIKNDVQKIMELQGLGFKEERYGDFVVLWK